MRKTQRLFYGWICLRASFAPAWALTPPARHWTLSWWFWGNCLGNWRSSGTCWWNKLICSSLTLSVRIIDLAEALCLRFMYTYWHFWGRPQPCFRALCRPRSENPASCSRSPPWGSVLKAFLCLDFLDVRSRPWWNLGQGSHFGSPLGSSLHEGFWIVEVKACQVGSFEFYYMIFIECAEIVVYCSGSSVIPCFFSENSILTIFCSVWVEEISSLHCIICFVWYVESFWSYGCLLGWQAYQQLGTDPCSSLVSFALFDSYLDQEMSGITQSPSSY